MQVLNEEGHIQKHEQIRNMAFVNESFKRFGDVISIFILCRIRYFTFYIPPRSFSRLQAWGSLKALVVKGSDLSETFKNKDTRFLGLLALMLDARKAFLKLLAKHINFKVECFLRRFVEGRSCKTSW